MITVAIKTSVVTALAIPVNASHETTCCSSPRRLAAPELMADEAVAFARVSNDVNVTAPTDPTQTDSARLNRRFFVGISAAATLSGPTLALADPAVSKQWVGLSLPDADVRAYAAWPAGAGPK